MSRKPKTQKPEVTSSPLIYVVINPAMSVVHDDRISLSIMTAAWIMHVPLSLAKLPEKGLGFPSDYPHRKPGKCPTWKKAVQSVQPDMVVKALIDIRRTYQKNTQISLLVLFEYRAIPVEQIQREDKDFYDAFMTKGSTVNEGAPQVLLDYYQQLLSESPIDVSIANHSRQNFVSDNVESLHGNQNMHDYLHETNAF